MITKKNGIEIDADQLKKEIFDAMSKMSAEGSDTSDFAAVTARLNASGVIMYNNNDGKPITGAEVAETAKRQKKEREDAILKAIAAKEKREKPVTRVR